MERHCQHSAATGGNIQYEGEIVLRYQEVESEPMECVDEEARLEGKQRKGLSQVGLLRKLTL